MYQSEHASALSRHAPDPADDDDTNAARDFSVIPEILILS